MCSADEQDDSNGKHLGPKVALVNMQERQKLKER